MEPERNIEKLLREHAKKRRAEGGDAFKLHAATRRLLQGEVARRTPPPSDERAPSFWAAFGRRLAFALSIACIAFISAALLLPGWKRKAQSLLAVNNLKQIGVATKLAAEANDGRLPATLDVLTNALGTDKVLLDPQTGTRFAYLGAGKNFSNLEPDSVLAYSTEDKKGHAVLLADGSVQQMNNAQFSRLMEHGSPELARSDETARRELAETPMPAAPAQTLAAAKTESGTANTREKAADEPDGGAMTGTDSGIVTNGLAMADTAGNRDRNRPVLSVVPPAVMAGSTELAFGGGQKFVPADKAAAQNLFKNTTVQTRAIPVLATFQVQQSGNVIRVVDADGSVYQGFLNTEVAVAQNQSSQANLTPAPGASLPMPSKDSDTVQKIQSVIVNNAFRVSGLNQTLKQNVVFTGNLLEMTAIAPAAQSNSQNVSANQAPAMFWANTRITGTAVIDHTNRVEINAVPLAP